MLTIENNPRAVRSPYGRERVTRARNRKNSPPPKKIETDAPASSPLRPNLHDPGRGRFVPTAIRTNLMIP